MNWLSCLAGLITGGATIVHGVIGTKEFWLFKPPADSASATQSWTQSLAGWQWVSWDLAFATLGFFVIGLTDWIENEPQLLAIAAMYFVGTGLGWLMTIAFTGKPVKNRFLVLGQWILCWVVAIVAWLASSATG
jgi:hypothetical protein